MKQEHKRFRLHAVAIELKGPGSEALAKAFDYFTDRPEQSEESDPYSVTLEIKIGHLSSGAVAVQRLGNFSYGQLIAESLEDVVKLGLAFLHQEISHLLEKSGLHQFHGLALGLPDGAAALVILPGKKERAELAGALRESGCVLLSEHSPLLNRLGQILPYPLQLSKEAAALPLARVTEKFSPGFLLAARASLKNHPQITLQKRWRTTLGLARELSWDVESPSRLLAAACLIARSRNYLFQLSGDSTANANALLSALGLGTALSARPHGKK